MLLCRYALMLLLSPRYAYDISRLISLSCRRACYQRYAHDMSPAMILAAFDYFLIAARLRLPRYRLLERVLRYAFRFRSCPAAVTFATAKRALPRQQRDARTAC